MTAFRAVAVLLASACLWLVLWLATAAAEQVSIRVESGQIVWEPAYVVLKVRVEPDEHNRELWVIAYSDGMRRTSSFEQLEGARSRKTRWVRWPDMPAGEYEIVAVVVRAQPQPAWRATAAVTVLGR